MPAMDRHPVNAAVLKTKLGSVGVQFNERGVTGLDFTPTTRAPGKSPLPAFIRQLASDLDRYAAGKLTAWRTPVSFLTGTEFQKKVWRALQAIPHGETRSYAWVAQLIGPPRATRAVGAACGANPIPIIVPCHRVVASDGSLGGFSGGLHRKRQLLKIEGAKI